MKVIKKLIVMLILSVFIISMVAATAHAVSVPKVDKQIESKEKVAKVKVTWNANGGKIGSKKTVDTSVKKGAKLNKLAATPKRSKYTFQGWYTKKSGGKKVTTKTKITKKMTFYARWSRNSASTTTVSKVVGHWMQSTDYKKNLIFYSNGTFHYYLIQSTVYSYRGTYSVSGGKIYFKNVVFTNEGYKPGYKNNEPNSFVDFVIVSDSHGDQLRFDNTGNSFTGSSWWRRY